ncbi:MAG TPA: non-homologous end-joining DNA ligase [Opitutaceae bacterium]|nr:non-homologous end-joining DNA ligase [Opitutaceae bacterium]
MPTKSRVNFTHLEKVFFPKAKFTKGDLVRYYIEAAPCILPHLRDRPVTLVRFPDGIGGESFFEKNAPRFTPGWVRTFSVPRRRHEGDIDYILINDADTLAWCANLASIELHPFLHRVPKLDSPTAIAFDLDPGPGADLRDCAEIGFLLREMMAGLGLEAWPKVSGSKGLQVYVPLNTPSSYQVTGPFAHAVAGLLERRHPDRIVTNMSKALRKGKVLIDWSQNSGSKTTVCVYSVRAKREEPFVSMPVTWDELKRLRRPESLFFTPAEALRRMRQRGDLFEPVLKTRQRLPKDFVRKAGAAEPEPAGSLREYRRKRDFQRTEEPPPEAKPAPAGKERRFVIQKHAASHLHYDFRLEMGGTLKSWAVPKGLPTEPGVKRSAFAVEDHPLGYLKFEGTIPQGQYGGGTVMVWDIGTYRVLKGSYGEGSLHLLLRGRKLKGEWHLFKIRTERGKDVWLVARSGAAMKPLGPRQEDSSVLTRRSMARIARDHDAEWNSHRR